MRRLLIPLVVFALVAMLLGAGLAWRRDELPSPFIGKPAPPLDGPRLNAPERRLTLTDLSGEPAVVNVWASWCVACLEEHEQIMALSERLPVYGINYKDERPKAKAWLARNGNAYRATVYDAEGTIGMDWGVYGVPETYLLDAKGVVRYKHVGALTPQAIEAELLPRVRRLRGDGA